MQASRLSFARVGKHEKIENQVDTIARTYAIGCVGQEEHMRGVEGTGRRRRGRRFQPFVLLGRIDIGRLPLVNPDLIRLSISDVLRTSCIAIVLPLHESDFSTSTCTFEAASQVHSWRRRVL